MDKNLGIDEYEIGYWIWTLGSTPVERVAYENRSSDSWSTDVAHVFKLENGTYACVTEAGDSCYSAADADIALFPTETAALEAFEKWRKCNG